MAELTTAEFLKQTSAHYDAHKDKWLYAMRLESGDYIDDEYVEDYLLKKPVAEADAYYDDRKKGLDPDLLYSSLVGSITGQLFGAESVQKIHWAGADGQGVLGMVDDEASRAWQLVHNVDGAGQNLAVWKRRLVRALLCCEEVYVLIDGPTTEAGPVRWVLLPPTMVPDHHEAGLEIQSAKVRTERDERASIKEKPVMFTRNTLFLEEGWEAYEHPIGKSEEEAALVDGDDYAFWRTARREQPILPIFRVTLPFAGLGYLLARKAAALLNKESEKDAILRSANMPRLVWKKRQAGDPGQSPALSISEGSNAVEIDAEEDLDYITPPTNSVDAASATITDKRTNFFISAYQRYGDAAKEVTATEARQDDRSGREALLELLASVLDETVREALWRTEQIESPDDPSAWGRATVKREGTFRPAEPEKTREAKRSRYLGEEPVPMTFEVFRQVVLEQWASDGYEIENPEEAERDILRQWRLREMTRLTEAGIMPDIAAVQVGFEGEELRRLIRRDIIPVNGQ